MYFPHPRLRRRAHVLVLVSMVGTLACTRTERSPAADTTGSPAMSSSAAPADTDDFGAPLPTDASFAARVVSLNPAATEIIFAIGAQARLVGRSAWDEFPAAAKEIPSLGDGIRPNVEAVLQARPTMVILYATAENRAAAEALTRAGVRVVALRVDRIAQFVSLTQRLGVALGAIQNATTVADSVQRTLALVREITSQTTSRRVVWPLWKQPVMVVGSGSYLDELIVIAGGSNVFHDLITPSPVVGIEEIAERDPDAIIASSATFADLRARPQWRAVRAMRDSQWVVHDPALTGRPSVVLGMAAVSLARALHPELAARLPVLPAASPSVPR